MKLNAPGSPAPKWADRLLLALLAACAIALPRCRLDPGTEERKFVTVRLNDSLKQFRSVEIVILADSDTTQVVGEVWSGNLPNPGSVPSYELDEDETRDLSVRVRAYDSENRLVMDRIISEEGGEQVIVDLPLPDRNGNGSPGNPPDTTGGPGPGPGSGPDPLPRSNPYHHWKYWQSVDVRLSLAALPKGTVIRKFPLLVRLTEDNFTFSLAGASGQDLRFTNRQGKALPYEIARWMGERSPRYADIWVQTDSLASGSDTAGMVMYWGNATAASESDGAKVFAPGDGYGSVLHLSEESKGDSAEFQDATGRNHATGGTGDGKNLPKKAEGVVGSGLEFQNSPFGSPMGTSGQSTLSMEPAFDPGSETWTLQAWIRRSGTGEGVLFQKGDAKTAGNLRFQIVIRGFTLGQVAVNRDGSQFNSGAHLPLGQFAHLSLVYTGSRVDVYVDGIFADGQAWGQSGDPRGRLVMGAHAANGEGDGFIGFMDEVWFASAVRSAEWVRLSYENQRPGSKLVVLRP